MILAEAEVEVRRLSGLLDNGLATVRETSAALAAAERDYRKARAESWLTVEGTAAFREAQVDGLTADLRYARDLAEGTRRAALESVRSRQTQISAIQTLLSAHRAEAEIAGRGPR